MFDDVIVSIFQCVGLIVQAVHLLTHHLKPIHRQTSHLHTYTETSHYRHLQIHLQIAQTTSQLTPSYLKNTRLRSSQGHYTHPLHPLYRIHHTYTTNTFLYVQTRVHIKIVQTSHTHMHHFHILRIPFPYTHLLKPLHTQTELTYTETLHSTDNYSDYQYCFPPPSW